MAEFQLAEIEKEVSPIVESARSVVINTEADVDNASDFLKKIKDTEKLIENKRLELTKPLNQSLKNINDMFKKAAEPLSEARSMVTNKILSWKRIEAEKRAKEEERRRKIQEAHEKKGHTINAPAYVAPVANKIGNVQTVKRWTFEIVDFAKVPDDFKGIDSVKVNSAIRDGVREIAGMKIFQEESLSIVNR